MELMVQTDRMPHSITCILSTAMTQKTEQITRQQNLASMSESTLTLHRQTLRHSILQRQKAGLYGARLKVTKVIREIKGIKATREIQEQQLSL